MRNFLHKYIFSEGHYNCKIDVNFCTTLLFAKNFNSRLLPHIIRETLNLNFHLYSIPLL